MTSQAPTPQGKLTTTQAASGEHASGRRCRRVPDRSYPGERSVFVLHPVGRAVSLNNDTCEWIALRRVRMGTVARVGSTYLQGGRRMPCFVPPTIDRLITVDHIELHEQDNHLQARITDSGEARFAELDRRCRQENRK